MSKRPVTPITPARHKREHLTTFQGAIIDADGNEVPITQQMIQAACSALEGDSYVVPRSKPSAASARYSLSSSSCVLPMRKRENSRRTG